MSQANPELRDDPLAEATEVPRTTVPSQDMPPEAAEKMATNYNMKSPAVKRILREAAENAKEDRTVISAAPLDDNIFEWHFTIRGPPDTPYELGMYHGRIILPSNYPMAPPNIMLLNPSGRFDINTKICLSISSYHPESWQPSWSIRTALTALRSFMATDSPGAIGSTQCSAEIRKEMARKSRWFECSCCGFVFAQLDWMEIDESPEIKTVPKDLRQKVEAHLTNQIPRRNAKQSPTVMIPYPRPDIQAQNDPLQIVQAETNLPHPTQSADKELDFKLSNVIFETTVQSAGNPAAELRQLSDAERPASNASGNLIEDISNIPTFTNAPQSPTIFRYMTDMAIAVIMILIGIIVMKRIV